VIIIGIIIVAWRRQWRMLALGVSVTLGPALSRLAP